MSMQVIGAGLGRTGTMSLKKALEILLGKPCYHMIDLLNHMSAHTPIWSEAALGNKVDWDQLLAKYCGVVDEPGSMNWESLMEYYPNALIILSTREVESWWRSASSTILRVKYNPPPPEAKIRVAWHEMMMQLQEKIYPEGVDDKSAVQARFLSHMEHVKATVPKEKLLVWEVSDGWEPICKALNLPVPDVPFPHVNTTGEFRTRETSLTMKPRKL